MEVDSSVLGTIWHLVPLAEGVADNDVDLMRSWSGIRVSLLIE